MNFPRSSLFLIFVIFCKLQNCEDRTNRKLPCRKPTKRGPTVSTFFVQTLIYRHGTAFEVFVNTSLFYKFTRALCHYMKELWEKNVAFCVNCKCAQYICSISYFPLKNQYYVPTYRAFISIHSTQKLWLKRLIWVR